MNNLEPEDALFLVVRKNGTWDYRYAMGYNDAVVLEYLKMIVERLEAGTYVKDPK